jgi:hypothetical protein
LIIDNNSGVGGANTLLRPSWHTWGFNVVIAFSIELLIGNESDSNMFIRGSERMRERGGEGSSRESIVIKFHPDWKFSCHLSVEAEPR